MPKKQVRVYFEVKDGPVGSESLWAKPVRPGEYQLDNIPFFANGVALRDIVRTEDRDGKPWFVEVVRSLGHSTIRILFSPEYNSTKLLMKLQQIGCGIERSSVPEHVAVDVPPTVGLHAAETILYKPAVAKQLSYEVAAERTGPGNWSN